MFSIVMGIFILASLVYVVSQIMHRLDDKAQAPNAAAVVADSATLPPSQLISKFSGLELPAGAQIMQLVPNGAQLIIWVRVPQEGERLIMVDTRRAQVTGEMRVTYKQK